jgi:ATP-dependent DNA helicase RecG
MDEEHLAQLAQNGESEIVEFKRSTGQLPRAAETLCAMLNGNGGRVFFGVSSGGQLLGQTISDKTLREIAELQKHFEPPANLGQGRIKLDNGKEILFLEARPNPEARPYVWKGRPYERLGPTTSVMPQSTYQRLLTERDQQGGRWENLAARGWKPADLDSEEILRTVRLGISAGRMPESTGHDVTDILNRLGLLAGEEARNAAVALFGRRFMPAFPQCHLRMARFRGVEKSEFIDQRQLEGHCFGLLEEAMLFLRRHLPVAGRIVPGLFEREDEPLFPLEALREALVNAFCHRDYTVVGGAVSLAVYDDRLEIWSDGTLPFGLTPEDLKRDHPSRPRNPLIAQIFYLRGVIERWGRGTQQIVSLCVKAGHPEPEFGEQAGSVWVRFRPSRYSPPLRVEHDLSERQREILHILARSSPLAFREIRKEMSKAPPDRTLREDLIHLKRLGLVDLDGRGRGATWRLKIRQE